MRPVSAAMLGLVAAGCSVAAGAGHGRRQATATPTSSVFVLPSASPAPNINASKYDLTQHYCRLWRHASVVAEGKIYIDGGETYVPKNNGTFTNTPEWNWTKGINNHLVVIDLSKNFSNMDTEPYSRILKGPQVPSSLMEHALWFSRATRKIYQIGGWWSASNIDDPGFKELTEIPEAELWDFDVVKKEWTPATGLTIKNRGKLQRPGAAAYCDAPSVNRSYLFQGYVEQRSDKEYIDYAQWSEYKFIEGLLELDTSDTAKQPILTNISVPLQMGGKDFGPRMNGAMVHVPVGKYGILVQIGGQITVHPTPYGKRIPDASGGNNNIPLNFVDIYDIESGFWFRQQTFGLAPDGIPSGRSDICAVVVPAPDNSSFNIYMVGGVDNYATHTTKGEIWVLTLPTFQWVLVHSAPETALYGHTCHALGETLVIVGGMFMTPYGDVGNCASTMPAAFFSLATLNYTSTYDAAGAARVPPVPERVVTAVGGTASGGAYIQSPKVWSDLYLQYVFNPSLPRPSYAPTYALADPGDSTGNGTTSPPVEESPTGLSGGAIAGIVIGALIGVAALLGAAFLWLRRRRSSTSGGSHRSNELPGDSQVSESEKPSQYHLYGNQIAEAPAQMRSELGSGEHTVSELAADSTDPAGWGSEYAALRRDKKGVEESAEEARRVDVSPLSATSGTNS